MYTPASIYNSLKRAIGSLLESAAAYVVTYTIEGIGYLLKGLVARIKGTELDSYNDFSPISAMSKPEGRFHIHYMYLNPEYGVPFAAKNEPKFKFWGESAQNKASFMNRAPQLEPLEELFVQFYYRVFLTLAEKWFKSNMVFEYTFDVSYSFLSLRAKFYDLTILRLMKLLNWVDIDVKNSLGLTELHMAIYRGDYHEINILLKKGANLNIACTKNELNTRISTGFDLTATSLGRGHLKEYPEAFNLIKDFASDVSRFCAADIQKMAKEISKSILNQPMDLLKLISQYAVEPVYMANTKKGKKMIAGYFPSYRPNIKNSPEMMQSNKEERKCRLNA